VSKVGDNRFGVIPIAFNTLKGKRLTTEPQSSRIRFILLSRIKTVYIQGPIVICRPQLEVIIRECYASYACSTPV